MISNDFQQVWRCGIHLLWLCPYWIIEIVIVGLRLPPIWTCQLQSDDSCVQALTVRFVTSCARIGLALILLTTDGLTAFQVTRLHVKCSLDVIIKGREFPNVCKSLSKLLQSPLTSGSQQFPKRVGCSTHRLSLLPFRESFVT